MHKPTTCSMAFSSATFFAALPIATTSSPSKSTRNCPTVEPVRPGSRRQADLKAPGQQVAPQAGRVPPLAAVPTLDPSRDRVMTPRHLSAGALPWPSFNAMASASALAARIPIGSKASLHACQMTSLCPGCINAATKMLAPCWLLL